MMMKEKDIKELKYPKLYADIPPRIKDFLFEHAKKKKYDSVAGLLQEYLPRYLNNALPVDQESRYKYYTDENKIKNFTFTVEPGQFEAFEKMRKSNFRKRNKEAALFIVSVYHHLKNMKR